MKPDYDRSQPVSLHGEVVEICEGPEQRTAKVVIHPSNLLKIPVDQIQDSHLGDNVVIDARVTVQGVQPVADSASTGNPALGRSHDLNDLPSTSEGEE